VCQLLCFPRHPPPVTTGTLLAASRRLDKDDLEEVNNLMRCLKSASIKTSKVKNLYPSERNRSALLAVYVVNCVDLCHEFCQCQQLRQPTTETMSSLKVETLHREFFCNGTRIPDPAPGMSVEQVRELLTPAHPELATATLEGPEDTGTALRYSFSRAIGSKG